MPQYLDIPPIHRIIASIKSGYAGHPLYGVWYTIKARCNNSQHRDYKDYGGRDIALCDEWSTVSPFIEWSLANGWQKGLHIDRINNDGNYEPSNCHFVTCKENAHNRRPRRKKA